MEKFEFMFSLLKAQVQGSIRGLEDVEQHFGDLTMRSQGMKEAFQDILNKMNELEERYE